jgi:hypothetical protein
MQKIRFRAAATALAGILIAIGGCSDALTSPDSARQALSRGGGQPRFNVMGSSASEVIGPKGGTLVTTAGDRLTFPAGALSHPTEITLTSMSTQVGVQIEPRGLVFPAGRQPVLTLSTAGSDADSFEKLEVAYVNDDGSITEVLTSSVGDATLSAQMSRFGGLLGIGH